MSGMDSAIQAVLLQAQALNEIAASIPAVLPGAASAPFSIVSTATITIAFPAATGVSDSNCTSTSKIFLQPTNASAAAIAAYVDNIADGSFVIHHPGSVTGETFSYLIID